MDFLHLQGVEFIKTLQSTFMNQSEAMIFASHMSDPRNAFLVYFPLAYVCMTSLGIRVMWLAAIAECLNAILKWLLHGERPFWWVNETELYQDPPTLRHFRLTCETGPGSPSGHAMVTSAVWFIMIQAVINSQISRCKYRPIMTWILWMTYIVVMLVFGLSRCYIATHFPHQILLGILTGIVLGMVFSKLPCESFTLTNYITTSFILLFSGPALYWFLETLGYDPLWSVALAQKWCAQPNWIHLDTTLFFSLIRDASALLGLGVAQYRCEVNKEPVRSWLSYKFITLMLSLCLTRGSEYIALPQDIRLVFYCLAYLRHFMLPYVIVLYIPTLSTFLISVVYNNSKLVKIN